MLSRYVSSVYDEHVNAQSLKIKKIQITRMYQSDPLSCSAHLGMEEEKKRGKYGAYAKVFYTLPAPLFETQFPPCLLWSQPRLNKRRSQTFLETSHCKHWEFTGIQSRKSQGEKWCNMQSLCSTSRVLDIL